MKVRWWSTVRIHASMSEARDIVFGRYVSPPPADDSVPFFLESCYPLQAVRFRRNTRTIVELEVPSTGMIQDATDACAVERWAVAAGRNARIIRVAEP